MVFQLDEKLVFPNPQLGEPDGLLAVGGDLGVDRLLLAYSNGIFPWYSFRDEPEILWWCPMRRFVIFPAEIHVSHSMQALLKKNRYKVTVNEDFEAVINQCSRLRIRHQGAWLGRAMTEAYMQLHEQGFAASIEVWDGCRLVGGLYGVTIGSAFFGESMFSLEPNTSKLALIHLARFLEKHGGKLIDCQFETAHLQSMGGRFIDYREYMELIG